VDLIWGIFLTVLTLIGWLGQVIYAISPKLAARLGIGEAESDVDPVFYIDARGEAIWDALIIWTLPVAGILLMLSNPLWIYFALLGGGSYLYFSGRNLITRSMMQRHGIRIGTPNNIRAAYLFCTLWGLAAVITIVMALVEINYSWIM